MIRLNRFAFWAAKGITKLKASVAASRLRAENNRTDDRQLDVVRDKVYVSTLPFVFLARQPENKKKEKTAKKSPDSRRPLLAFPFHPTTTPLPPLLSFLAKHPRESCVSRGNNKRNGFEGWGGGRGGERILHLVLGDDSLGFVEDWNVFFVRGVEHDTRGELDSYVVNYGIRASFQGGGRGNSSVEIPWCLSRVFRLFLGRLFTRRNWRNVPPLSLLFLLFLIVKNWIF